MVKEDEPCPICKTDKYLNPNLVLLVSSCMHKMCENCVERIFALGSAPCPVCRNPLRKSNFTKPKFEDLFVEKECVIRRRVWRIFNKRPEDFESLDAYNDYLESVEDIIFDLVNNENIQAIEDKIEEYRKENAEIIQRNIQKEMNEEMMLQQVLETQNREYQETLEQDLKERQLEQSKKLSRKTELIQQIAVSRKKATDILPAFMEEVSHAGAEGGKTSVKFASGKRGLSIQKQIEMNKKRLTEVVKYSNPFEDVLETPYNRDNDSPLLDISAYRDPSVVSFVMDKQAQILAGGFSVNLIYKRAIQSLQFGIFVEPVHEEQ